MLGFASGCPHDRTHWELFLACDLVFAGERKWDAALFPVRLADESNEFPARCSEVGTHYASSEGKRTIQAFVGGLISDEYDTGKYGGNDRAIQRRFHSPERLDVAKKSCVPFLPFEVAQVH